MLCLSRETNERIVIFVGGQIVATVMVVEVRGKKVRLGFDADPAVVIHREEVYKQIQKEVRSGDPNA
jgi:carbon storage regulator CsrA